MSHSSSMRSHTLHNEMVTPGTKEHFSLLALPTSEIYDETALAIPPKKAV